MFVFIIFKFCPVKNSAKSLNHLSCHPSRVSQLHSASAVPLGLFTELGENLLNELAKEIIVLSMWPCNTRFAAVRKQIGRFALLNGAFLSKYGAISKFFLFNENAFNYR